MRRILFSAFLFCSALVATAQIDTTAPTTKIFRPVQPRSKDHLMIQFGGALWQNKPDTIKTKGFSRTFNVYLLWDFPFKSSPKFSLALGPGFSTDHVFLDKMTAGIKDNTIGVIFDDRSDTVHFKKYKVATAFFELPMELRYSSNPESDGSSFKVALGLKAGALMSAWVKGKDLEDAAGNTVNEYIMKEKDKRFFNPFRFSATARLGYGHFSLFGSYSFTSLFKEGLGPQMKAMSIGLTISGL